MKSSSKYDAKSWGRTRAKREFLLAFMSRLAKLRLLRIRSGHYYSPIPSMNDLRNDAERVFDRSVRTLPGVDLNEAGQLRLLQTLAAYHDEQPFPQSPREGLRYFCDNYWFGQADALFLYAMLRHYRPRRIIEVGSGFSSAVMLDTNERFLNGSVEFTFIEPESSRLRSLLSPRDAETVSIVEQRVQDVDPDLFATLAANDILFIDSSHVSKAGSDVNHLLFEVLPSLNKGVLIHFHDIRYPFEYPQAWFELGVAWNEPYILRAFLQYNDCFSISLWTDYLISAQAEALQRCMPLCAQPVSFGVGGSLWLLKLR